jgi:aminocarboxymuconate-semialdehyde decarboxylase
MRHDVHSHFLPEPYVDRLVELDTPVGIEERDGALFVIHRRSGTSGVAGGNRIPLTGEFTDVDARIDWMEEYDVGTTLASVSTPNPLDESFTPEQSTELVRAINNEYADVGSRYPDRFAGLGMLPLREPEAAEAEVDRIADDPALHGVALPTSINGTKLSIPRLEPTFDRIDEHGLTVFLHPHGNRLSDTLGEDESFINPLVIFPTETTLQVTRLIYDGFFDRHEFDVVLSHMGGALLPLAGRIGRAYETAREEGTGPEEPIESYLERFYYDVISFHPPTLSAAIEAVGVEQFVFGTDYPFHEAATEATIADVEAVVSGESDLRAIMSETAEELFGI